MKMINEDQDSKQEINTETYQKKKKIKGENMEKNRYRNMSEEKNIKTKRISKNHRKAKNSQYNNE